MVNEEIISFVPLLYLYLFFFILVVIDTTSIYPSLTLKLLCLFNLPIFSLLLLCENPCIVFTFSSNLFTLHSAVSYFLFRSALSSFFFFSFFSFEGSSISFVRPYREGLVVLLEHPSGKTT